MAARRPLVHIGGRLQELPSGDTVAGGVSSVTVATIVTLTQSAYDALPTKDANTLYVIVPA